MDAENKPIVLYVDDEDINLELFKLTFYRTYQVYLAASAKDGFEVLQKHPEINVIISDWNMPVKNGLDFVKEAKKAFPDKVYCMLSGYDMNEQIQSALQDGIIKFYFEKPIKKEHIEKILE